MTRFAALFLVIWLLPAISLHAQDKKKRTKTEQKEESGSGSKSATKSSKDSGDPKKNTKKSADPPKNRKKKKGAAEESQTGDVIDIEQLRAIEEIDKELIPEKERRKKQKNKKEKEATPDQQASPDAGENTAKDSDRQKRDAGSAAVGGSGKRVSTPVKPAPVAKSKNQKKIRTARRFSKESQQEYTFYAERVHRHPDSADVIIKLPMTSQKNKDEVRLKKAVSLIKAGYADKSLVILKQMQGADPMDPNLNYWLGMAYLKAYNDNTSALPYFRRASEKTDFDYNFRSPEKNNRAPVDALFYLARLYHLTGDLEAARRTYQIFSGVQKKKSKLLQQSQVYLKQINTAEELLAIETPGIRVRNLGEGINTFYADFGAAPTFDGTELFFNSSRPRIDTLMRTARVNFEAATYTNDIFVSRLKAGKWQKPESFQLNTAENEFFNGISPNSRVISFYVETEKLGDLFESTYAFDTWQAPIEILEPVNTSRWGRFFAISEDRSRIVFASTRLGGFGGSDLFMIERQSDGKWGKPKNLGPSVNTRYNEDFPTLHPNGSSIFFSSDGENSIGGFDIFKTDFKGAWTTPVNIGAPVNSFSDDFFFWLSYDEKSAYFSKQADGGYGDLDIYQVTYTSAGFPENPILEASFNVDLKNMSNSTEVELTNTSTQETKVYKPNIRSGLFTVNVEPCTTYTVTYKKQGKVVKTDSFTSPCDK